MAPLHALPELADLPLAACHDRVLDQPRPRLSGLAAAATTLTPHASFHFTVEVIDVL